MPVLLENDITAPRLIILRGSPAVGKSTVAKKVAALNSAKKKAYVPVDDFQLYENLVSTANTLLSRMLPY